MSPASIAIAVAPNGGRRSKVDHPALPITAGELAVTARAALDAGAAMIHAHIRDRHGRHLLDAAAYREAIAAITRVVGNRLLIQITSESVGLYGPAEQIAVVKAVRPEAVSLALRELVPDASQERTFADFLLWLKREHVTPQIILYTADDVARFHDLDRRGLIPWRNVPILYVLGLYGAARDSVPADLEPFLTLPRPAHWMVCAFGRHEAACLLAAARQGGHARVGFENNLWRPDGSVAADNAEQVRTVASQLRGVGITLQTAADLRASWTKPTQA
jgi:3-keto-5-aminohexanoate cleavage enzyme